MSSMEMSAEYAAELRQMLHEGAESRVNGEEVLAARRLPARLSEKAAPVLTPRRLYGFGLKLKAGGREVRLEGEAAAWDRGGLKVSTETRSGMTALTLESPGDGEKTTLVAIGVRDDPVSREPIGALQGGATAAG